MKYKHKGKQEVLLDTVKEVGEKNTEKTEYMLRAHCQNA
jgi:hypothetical protein